jgi:hypothetical protein
VLEHRAKEVERLYSATPQPDVVIVPRAGRQTQSAA